MRFHCTCQSTEIPLLTCKWLVKHNLRKAQYVNHPCIAQVHSLAMTQPTQKYIPCKGISGKVPYRNKECSSNLNLFITQCKSDTDTLHKSIEHLRNCREWISTQCSCRLHTNILEQSTLVKSFACVFFILILRSFFYYTFLYEGLSMAFIFLFVLFFLFSVSYFLIFFFFSFLKKILSFFSHGLFSFSYLCMAYKWSKI